MTVSFNLFDDLFHETLPVTEDDCGVFATDSETTRRRMLAGCIATLLTRKRLHLFRRLSHFVAAHLFFSYLIIYNSIKCQLMFICILAQ